ncbi:hypothetical protein [Teichococcus vastitatis]|jgi:uncharacterized protein involved in exopolysaccharide biosynthesis|uniref:Chain length determinant protein n=1 Tax=Teichococcus vastitatis TaxID=2307076 RepID=A0ABS9WBI6_9PROT|nr:hypothetical protein [Pseudoroseomonas vastitatis]MCI0756661.1 hypothetical protein [Pseudoroseomonas vastitatis]
MPLHHLLRGVLRLWRWLLPALLLMLGLGGAVILNWPRAYLAEAVVAPAETTGVAVSTLISANGLTPGSLLDTRPGGNFAVYLSALRSPEAAAMLARDTAILADLAAQGEAGLLAPLKQLLGLGRAPDGDDVERWLDRNLAVTQSLASVTWTLELAHPRREAALDALVRLHGFAEARVRQDLMAVAQRRIAALEGRLGQERDIYVRTPLFELLAQHQRIALVLRADEAVAARMVSGPGAPLRPSLPNRPLLLALLLVAAPLACLFLAACWVLLRGSQPPRRAGA